MDPLRFIIVASILANSVAAQPLRFMGRPVTVVEGELVTEVRFPKGPASICVGGPPRRQCYTAEKDFGKNPTVEVIKIDKTTSAMLFSASSGGLSGFMIHLALLRPGSGPKLENCFPPGLSVSSESQHTFFNHAQASKSPIFVTADYNWGIDESHSGEHRFIVSTYLYQYSELRKESAYSLQDRFMTARRYDIFANAAVITSEKAEILRRLALVSIR